MSQKSKSSKSDKSDKKNRDNFVKNPNSDDNPQKLENDSPISEEHTDQIGETGSVLTSHKDSIIHCLTIIGQIEGHYILPSQNKTTKYEHVIPLLVSIEEDERIDGLLILLNTVGGDVEAGLAIAEVISGMKKPTVSIVLGGGHSIGIPLAVAAKKSFIAKSASMTVHPVRTTGLTLGVPQTFEYFQRMQDRITTFVAENSDITKERYNELVLNTGELVMDIGTILEGEEAVEESLIDSVGTVSDAIDALYDMIKESKEPKETKKKSRAKSSKAKQ
ncbi:ATP-dependent Clp protease proteolytic subunit [Ruminococcus sp.]|uniref:ClpP family protease n=1 Tax=Ruminococcus sp. TaxID=41978 RepID=UPI002606C546|nr:ATP-dependent Clp protease proteolytic subunit [Ruminococcus sp.]MDD6988445.1 ATP-dependent Clp protease proteolytic subunit [Ruminococcus sp.]MDY6200758.1 ATP-dependent Clp protease proteolytic subunit [Ruminococcus sp.]